MNIVNGYPNFFRIGHADRISRDIAVIDADDRRFRRNALLATSPGEKVSHRNDRDAIILEDLQLGLEFGRLDGKTILRLVLESVVTEDDDLRVQIDRFGGRCRRGRWAGFSNRSGGLRLLLAAREDDRKEETDGKERREKTHFFPIAAVNRFATSLSGRFAVSWAKERAELLLHSLTHRKIVSLGCPALANSAKQIGQVQILQGQSE